MEDIEEEEATFTCEECKGDFPENDSYTITKHDVDMEVCEDCRNNTSFMCEDCEGTFHDYHANSINGDKTVCDSCFEEYTECDDCGAVLHRNDGTYPDDSSGNVFCDTDCASSSDYISCYDCGELRHVDDMQTDNDGDWFCEHCYTENVHGNGGVNHYDYKPSPIFDVSIPGKKQGCFYTSKSSTNQTCLGIELEHTLEGTNSQEYVDLAEKHLGEHVYYKDDSSLTDGIELVTHPYAQHAINWKVWKDLLKGMKDLGALSYDADCSCGVHVHIGLDNLGKESSVKNKVIAFMYLCKREIRAISRRRDSQWSGYCKIPDVDKEPRTILKNAKKKMGTGNSTRYSAFNFTYSTLELRFWRGTLNYDAFKVYLQFSANFSTFIRQTPLSYIMQHSTLDVWEKMLTFMPENVVKFCDRLAPRSEIRDNLDFRQDLKNYSTARKRVLNHYNPLTFLNRVSKNLEPMLGSKLMNDVRKVILSGNEKALKKQLMDVLFRVEEGDIMLSALTMNYSAINRTGKFDTGYRHVDSINLWELTAPEHRRPNHNAVITTVSGEMAAYERRMFDDILAISEHHGLRTELLDKIADAIAHEDKRSNYGYLNVHNGTAAVGMVMGGGHNVVIDITEFVPCVTEFTNSSDSDMSAEMLVHKELLKLNQENGMLVATSVGEAEQLVNTSPTNI